MMKEMMKSRDEKWMKDEEIEKGWMKKFSYKNPIKKFFLKKNL